MTQRTSDEEHRIALKVTKALTSELITLHQAGDTKARAAIMDYLAFADSESLVRFHDLIVGAE